MVKKSKQAYKNIREASELLKLEPHVLRFWESKFDKLEPMTRGGGRRYYSPGDMELLKVIQNLVHEEGMTIRAANRLINKEGTKALMKSPIPEKKGATKAEVVSSYARIQKLLVINSELTNLEERAKTAISQYDDMLNKIRSSV